MTRSTTKNSAAAGKAQAPKAGSDSSAAQQPAPAPVVKEESAQAPIVQEEPVPLIVEQEPSPVVPDAVGPATQLCRHTVKVRSATARLRRGGIEFTRDGVDIAPEDLTRDQIVAILSEPLLTVDMRDQLAELVGDGTGGY